MAKDREGCFEKRAVNDEAAKEWNAQERFRTDREEP